MTYFTARSAKVLFNPTEETGRFSDHVLFFSTKIIMSFSLHNRPECFAHWTSSANNLWSSAVRRGSAPLFKCQKVCILANCLVKGQPVSDNETHGGRSLEVLRAAGAYKSCRGDGQRLLPPGMVYEGCSWQLFREQNNAVKAAFHPPAPPSRWLKRDLINLFWMNKERSGRRASQSSFKLLSCDLSGFRTSKCHEHRGRMSWPTRLVADTKTTADNVLLRMWMDSLMSAGNGGTHLRLQLLY